MGNRTLCFVFATAFSVAAVAGPPVLQTDTAAEKLYDFARREAQYQSLLAMPDIEVEYGKHGRLRTVKGSTGLLLPEVSRLKAGDSGAAILQKLRPVLMASGSESLAVRLTQSRERLGGGYDLFLNQSINGIPVIDGGVNVRTNNAGEVVAVSSLFVPSDGASRVPKLTLQSAKEKLEDFLRSSGMAAASSIRLSEKGDLGFWTDQGKEEQPRLVWLIQAGYTTPNGEQQIVRFSIDAATGEVRDASRELFGMNRTTYSLHGLTDISSIPAGLQLLWNEGSPNPADAQAYAAYNLVVKPRNLWASHGLNYDTLAIVAHWGAPSNANAAYTQNQSGYPYLIFGDPLAAELDAVAHEYGHGIFRPRFSSVPSAIWNEWHAANEFYGDLSATLTDMAERGGLSPSETWRITSLILRDLSNPKSPLVANYALRSFRDWYPERRYCCGSDVPYSNATIFGHALFLIKNGGTHVRAGQPARHGPIPTFAIQPTPDTSLIQNIFAFALNDLAFFGTAVDGPNLKAATVGAARVFGGDSLGNNVANAWTAVGINSNCSGPPPTPNPTIIPEYCKGRHDISWAQTPGDTYHGQVATAGAVWDLAGQTILDAPVAECHPQVPGTRKFRMRACNGCGCSDWTWDAWMYYYSPCL